MNLKSLLPSFSSVAFGAAGFLSAIVTMFINTSNSLSVKWFIFLTWVFATITVVLVKIIINSEKEFNKKNPLPFEHPMGFPDEEGILLIRKNEAFANNIIIGIYFVNDEMERPAFAAHVFHVQEKIIQIKIIKSFLSEEKMQLLQQKGFSSLIVRPNIPYDLLINAGVDL